MDHFWGCLGLWMIMNFSLWPVKSQGVKKALRSALQVATIARIILTLWAVIF